MERFTAGLLFSDVSGFTALTERLQARGTHPVKGKVAPSASTSAAPVAIRKLVRERAGGNPFYVEETVRHLIEAGILAREASGFRLIRPITRGDLPGRVEAPIAARQDRLPAHDKRIAQSAAVIGRTFRVDLLQDVEGRGAAAACHTLEVHDLIRKTTPVPDSECSFTHALICDTAYASPLVRRRRRLHRKVADAIESRFAEERKRFLAVLGHHREHAGQRAEARACYLAGARAQWLREHRPEAIQPD